MHVKSHRDGGSISASALALVLSLALAACSSLGGSTCRPGEQPMVDDTLYFGTDRSGGAVSPAEWSGFLEHTVTPLFPQGLSVTQAMGQWRGGNGAVVRESTNVLRLVHPNDATSASAVAAIIAAYKAQFRQEAVLRVEATACVSF
jgi:hypothetical protein